MLGTGTASTLLRFDTSGGAPGTAGYTVRKPGSTLTVGYWRASEALVRLPSSADWWPTARPSMFTEATKSAKLQSSAWPGPSGTAPKGRLAGVERTER